MRFVLCSLHLFYCVFCAEEIFIYLNCHSMRLFLHEAMRVHFQCDWNKIHTPIEPLSFRSVGTANMSTRKIAEMNRRKGCVGSSWNCKAYSLSNCNRYIFQINVWNAAATLMAVGNEQWTWHVRLWIKPNESMPCNWTIFEMEYLSFSHTYS